MQTDPWTGRILILGTLSVESSTFRAEGSTCSAAITAFRDHLIKLDEANTSLVALLFWLGFRRKTISYVRRARSPGLWRSCLDELNVFAFSGYPVRLLLLHQCWLGCCCPASSASL